MEIAVIDFIILVAISGLTRGAGVLPDDALNAAVGETVMFTTTVTPPETPFIIVQWQFGDKDIITFNLNNITDPEYEGRITLFISTGSLQLRNLTHNDSGEYRVIIGPSGERPKDGRTRLDVHELVSNVTATPSSTELEPDSSVRLSCSSSGSSLSFLWLNGSSEVTASDRVQLTDGGSTLTMNVTRYDQGPFSCRVSNPVSQNTSGPIHLSIIYGPENMNVTIYPVQKYHKEGSDIIMMCSADSRPAAHFTWLLNGGLLPDTGPELRLINIQESQSGNYSCRAFNSKTLMNETSPLSVVSILTYPDIADIPDTCVDGCIAGIVIGVLIVCGGLCGGGYYLYRTKKQTHKPADRNATTGTGAEGQDNNAFAGNQEVKYADISIFRKTNGGTVQIVPQSNASEYAEIRVDNNPPRPSSPPFYDAHEQRMKKPAPQPLDLYAQVHKK